nr:hypothetical protein [Haliscomenobacter sp.]
MLKAQNSMLADLAAELEGFDLETLLYPHPISGPMDARQRFDFFAGAYVEASEADAGIEGGCWFSEGLMGIHSSCYDKKKTSKLA